MFRNLLHIIRRFKMASLLNILGLSVAFASFIIIMMQVQYETGFNNSVENSECIFRVENIENRGTDDGYMAVSAWPLLESLKLSPHVEYAGGAFPKANVSLLSIKDENGVRSFNERTMEITKDFPKVFSFDMVEGSADAMYNPQNMLIPESLSKKFFKGESALGKVITDDRDRTFFVGGVFRDFADNTTVNNIVYIPFDEDKVEKSWGSKGYHFFVRFDSPNSANGFFSSIIDHLNYEADGFDSKEDYLKEVDVLYRLTSIRDIFYVDDVKFDYGQTGSRQTTFLLICIAFIILIIAGINFTNFSTALTPMRIKSINTQKVLGSSVSRLRLSLLMEAVCIAFISFLISIALVYLCHGTFVQSVLSPKITILGNIPLITATALISIITGFLAGLYPSFYLTSFSPALVLKGSFGLSPRGRRLRSVLLCMQYVASIILLVVSVFMMLQHKYLISRSFGYDKEQIVTADLTDRMLSSIDFISNEFKNNENIEASANAFLQISCVDDYPIWGGWFIDKSLSYNCIVASPDILKALGLKVTEGRDFLDSDQKRDWPSTYIFNQAAKEKYGLEVGSDVGSGIVAGFTTDFQYSTFRKTVGPMAFLVVGPNNSIKDMFVPNVLYVRLAKNAPYGQTVEFIRNTLKKVEPLADAEVIRLDECVQNAYMKEKNISSLITSFSIMAILISIVGIFSLVIFETEYKKKEIGVRKVFGSTTSEIMQMINKQYVRMILICTVIATPIAYIVVNRWLNTFTQRTPIYWWVFVLAFITISIVTLATITYQNYKAASANPVDSVKGE